MRTLEPDVKDTKQSVKLRLAFVIFACREVTRYLENVKLDVVAVIAAVIVV